MRTAMFLALMAVSFGHVAAAENLGYGLDLGTSVRGSTLRVEPQVNVAPGDEYEVTVRLFEAGRLVAEQSARLP